MRFSNLHTHTTFSDGKGTVKENVESAIAKNMLSLGFSDHSFTACDTSYCMKLEDYGAYADEVLRAREEYRGQIPIFLGIEKDYYSDVDRSTFDYVIASVHYIVRGGICYPIDHSARQQEECIRDAFGGSVMDMARCYYDMVIEHAQSSKPTLIGHFDVLNKFSIMPERDERYISLTVDAMTEVAKYCKYFEINTGGISRGWRTVPYPSDYLLRHLLSLGGEVVINSDSHHPDNLDFHFNESVQLLREVGYDHFCVFNGTGFDKVKL
ncbi:MAG: histidinol-phosphatase [Clostridia bacterium]|nr:histidinol-phosphatase [Clostridia bacterium]